MHNGKLSERAMLVTLNISIWLARKYDAKVSREVAAAHGTAADAGNYIKRLFPAVGTLKEIQTCASDARDFHYSRTLPWLDNGPRILPAAAFLDYSNGMRQRRHAFDTLADRLETEYPHMLADAPSRLNGLFNAADFPSVSKVRRLYAFATRIDPLPDAADFRVSLQSDEVDAIRRDIESRASSVEAAARRDLWTRVHEAVSHMVERLGQPDGIFRDTLLSNLRELTDLLPALNITGDTDLEAARAAIVSKLLTEDADTLRKNKTVRQAVATDAAEILRNMSGYCGQPDVDAFS